MKFIRDIGRRWRQQRILAEEIEAHIEQLTEGLRSSGYGLQDAKAEARRQFGNHTALLEESRAVWRVKWLDALLRDLRFTWRMARRQPWTTAAAVASIAIGIGANSAVTSVADTILLNPLGIRHSDRIVAATVHLTKLQMTEAETSGAELRDLEALKDTFSSAAATERRAWTAGGGQPIRLLGSAVTPEFFKVFEQTPALGHYFDGSNAMEVLLSDALWSARFGRSKSVVGQNLILDDKPYRIVGVAAPDFHFPAKAMAWVPLMLTPDRFKRGNNMTLSLYARLGEGVSTEQAQRRVNHAINNVMADPAEVETSKLAYGLDVLSLSERVAGNLRLPILLLWAAAAVLLLAACANVAGLLLARAGGRRREIAIRISVGASRFQVLRQLATESVVLALTGGAVGVLVAYLCLQAAKQQSLPYQDMLLLTSVNYRLLLYGLGLAVASSLLFGMAPAFELLREQHTGGMVRARRRWFQNFYIVGQVSAAMLLLVVTGLLLKSLKAVEALQPGFDPHNLTTAFLIKPSSNQNAFFDRVLAILKSSPGVESAALSFSLPFGGESPTSLFDIKEHHHLPGVPEWHAEAYQVSPDYFRTLRIPLLRGRVILDSDTAESAKVCVIDSTLATRFFTRENPIGQQIAMYGGYARIVGVVAAVRDMTLESISRPAVYYSLAQIPYFPQVDLVVRSQVSASSLIRSAVTRANPAVPVFDIKTMEERIDSSVSTRSVMALLVTVFAGISILLAALGIHGVLAQVVTERTSEIGIRMALGAKSRDIFSHYARQGLQLSFLGIGIGLAAAAGCRGWLGSFLYQVQPIDPETILIGGFCVLALSAIAVLAPSWRASHVDPQLALRSE